MSELLTFTVSGLVSGALYALIALGLVFIYRSSNVINFAFAGLAGFGGYAFTTAFGGGARPYALALVAAMVATAASAAIAERFVIRPLIRRGPLTASVGTLGLLTVFTFAIIIFWGGQPRTMSSAFGDRGFQVGALFVSVHQLLAAALALVACLAVWLLLQLSKTGRALRAIAEDREVAALMAIPVERYDSVMWAVAGAVAAAAGVMITPSTGLNLSVLTLVVVKGFAAAMIGRLVSIPWTVVGALALGFMESMVVWKLQTIPGIREIITFGIIAIALTTVPTERRIA